MLLGWAGRLPTSVCMRLLLLPDRSGVDPLMLVLLEAVLCWA